MANPLPLAVELMRLTNRIQKFYSAFNKEQWAECFHLVDPELRENRVDFKVYADSLATFFERFGPIEIERIADLKPHLREKSPLYRDRPFAFGMVVWRDRENGEHVFRERWVKARGTWYTRMVGLV